MIQKFGKVILKEGEMFVESKGVKILETAEMMFGFSFSL